MTEFLVLPTLVLSLAFFGSGFPILYKGNHTYLNGPGVKIISTHHGRPIQSNPPGRHHTFDRSGVLGLSNESIKFGLSTSRRGVPLEIFPVVARSFPVFVFCLSVPAK